MLIEVILDGTTLKYAYPDGTQYPTESPLYRYLEEIGGITESTTAESGSATVKLSLLAYPNLGLPLGRIVRIRDASSVLFEGVVADVLIDTSITLQLEA